MAGKEAVVFLVDCNGESSLPLPHPRPAAAAVRFESMFPVWHMPHEPPSPVCVQFDVTMLHVFWVQQAGLGRELELVSHFSHGEKGGQREVDRYMHAACLEKPSAVRAKSMVYLRFP